MRTYTGKSIIIPPCPYCESGEYNLCGHKSIKTKELCIHTGQAHFKNKNCPEYQSQTLEDRVKKIEKWIDFWETVETPWNKDK